MQSNKGEKPVQADVVNIGIKDGQLIERYIMGDNAALEKLIRKYQNRIYNVILKICGNPDDAAELTQETFVKVIENISKFQGRSGFYTWAFRIAVNLTLTHRKRKVRFAFRSIDAEQGINEEQAAVQLKDILADDNMPEPAEIIARKELCGLIMKSLARLDDQHRTIIVLRDIEGMNYAQIAKVLNIELGTVKSRLSRARSSLKKVLETLLP
ncbi:MAG: RNA polymerase sigma factor [Planctomycetota bacterium]|jgi:RNA polymerase sigma-70 factor (ECF subfamily)